ncbi:MAG: sialate O-acetylesterase [Rhodothermales bacterium]|jgi:sialate O-acetylesterase
MKLRLILLTLFCGFSPLWAAVTLPAVIANGMVLQREMNLPIWGWGTAGDAVSVGFAGQTVKSSVAADGSWKVELQALEASAESRVMRIVVGSDSIDLADVVVGEVWVCSGQSNMGFSLDASARPTRDAKDQPVADYIKAELSTHFDPLIRQITSPMTTSYDQEKTSFNGAWVKADSEANKKPFTAAGYFFAKELRAKLNVPIGLLKCPWGGKKIQPFIPSTQYKKDAALSKYYNESRAKLAERLKTYDADKAEAKYQVALTAWKEKVKKAKAAGKRAPRRPNKQVSPALDPNFPSTLYNAMVNPLVPYGIKGAIWYQGESNAGGAAANGFGYETYLRTLVDGWRDRWGQGDFPLYYCQLAQFKAVPTEPVDANGWVDVCNDMRKALTHKNVGMAVLNDCGEVSDIHPRNKVDAGKRLALWALAKDYGFYLVYSGPLYKSHTTAGNKVTVDFESVGEGLLTARKHLLDPAKPVDEAVKGFQICGKDRKWQWAKAKITGKSTVVVWHPNIAEPDEVRYAWAANPGGANLYNKSGLPTSVFSTKGN